MKVLHCVAFPAGLGKLAKADIPMIRAFITFKSQASPFLVIFLSLLNC